MAQKEATFWIYEGDYLVYIPQKYTYNIPQKDAYN